MNRREFIKGAASFGFPMIFSGCATAYRANETVQMVAIGTKGVIEYGHHGANYLRLLPDRTLEKMRADNACPKQKYARIPGGSPNEKPFAEFVRAVKGGPKVGSDFAYAGAMTQCSLLGVAALFDPNRELQWDFANRRFKNSSAANARLALPRQQGW